MSETGGEDIVMTRRGAVAEVRLNRPAKRNALTLAMWRALPTLMAEAAAAPDVRLVILRGAGGNFAAGADIAEFEALYASREAALANQQTMAAAMRAVETCPTPTLALIEGACVGGGCGLALACDLRFAATDARFGITPGKLGLVYGVADTRRLVAAVGVSAAKDILFTGRLMAAEEALRLGLIDRALPPADLADAAEALAGQLAGASAFTARATKAILARLQAGAHDDDAASQALFADAFEGPDFQEGRAAFMEKRPPRFA